MALGLAACGSVETSTRDVPPSSPLLGGTIAAERDYSLANLQVVVSRDLNVSERNGFYPITDIVWRGDPIGDRYEQIEDLFEIAGTRAATELDGRRPVTAHVELVRFHGVTERTRYSVGGVYNIEFNLTVLDNATGAVIEEARFIQADLPAPGGEAAVRLEQAGQTERVRVLDFLSYVLKRELSPVVLPGQPDPAQI